jgi:hypothetical protein
MTFTYGNILVNSQILREKEDNSTVSQSFPVHFLVEIQDIGFYITPCRYESNAIPWDLVVKEQFVKWMRSDKKIYKSVNGRS